MESNQYLNKTHCVVLGVSHKTCPVYLRDRLAFPASDLRTGLESLRKLPGLSEALILTTCNRTEIYAVTPSPEAFRDTLLNWWAENRRMDGNDMRPHCYYLSHIEAVSHLFSVISSVDSLVLGEYQILGQVREAFAMAQECETVGFFLNRLFQVALSIGKRVREETQIGAGAVSVAYASVELCRRELGDLSKCRAGVLGLGETGVLVARSLFEAGVRDFRFFNRTEFKAEIAARQFGGVGKGLDSLASELPGLDLLVACTGAPGYLLGPEQVSARSGDRPLTLVDIASPRDIDPAVGEVAGCSLYCMDDLNRVMLENRERRKKSADAARDLISAAVVEYQDWFVSLDVVPLLKKMRGHFQLQEKQELEKWRTRTTPEEFALLERFGDGLVAKLLHEPTVQLRKMGCQEGCSEVTGLLQRLFALGGGHG